MFANGNLLIVLLPLVALILAGLSVAGLWLWWDMSREEEEGPARRPEPAPPESPEPGSDVFPAAASPERASGGWLGRLIGDAPERPDASPPAPPSVPLSERGSRSVPPPMPGDVVEVFRIYRDLADGALIVEIEGQRYRSLGEIGDAQVGRRFIGNVQALAGFARLGDAEIPGEWSAESPFASRGESAAFSQSERQSRSVPPPPPAPASTQPPMPPPPSPPSPSQPAESPSLLGGLFGRGARQAAPEEEIDVRPVAEQIEELLQFRLTASDELRHRSIHVRPTVDGGVRIEVDGRFYDGVDAVEDEEVRTFIQSVIREWEARQ
jgi:hypothetical protein